MMSYSNVTEIDYSYSPKSYNQLDVEFDSVTGALWSFMKPKGRAAFNMGLLNDIRSYEHSIERSKGQVRINDQLHKLNFVVYASGIKDIYNLGGDLDLFIECIRNQDREKLTHYAELCIENMFCRIENYHLPLTTIALIQGQALGGGFESALAASVIIAEKSSVMALPEIKFDLFPGMGAYSLLCRRIGIPETEALISSGNPIEATQLYKMGVITVLAEDGYGEMAVMEYIELNANKMKGLRAMHKARHICNPIRKDELLKIVHDWVDTALCATDRDLRFMKALVHKQNKITGESVFKRNFISQLRNGSMAN